MPPDPCLPRRSELRGGRASDLRRASQPDAARRDGGGNRRGARVLGIRRRRRYGNEDRAGDRRSSRRVRLLGRSRLHQAGRLAVVSVAYHGLVARARPRRESGRRRRCRPAVRPTPIPVRPAGARPPSGRPAAPPDPPSARRRRPRSARHPSRRARARASRAPFGLPRGLPDPPGLDPLPVTPGSTPPGAGHQPVRRCRALSPRAGFVRPPCVRRRRRPSSSCCSVH